jgi:exoribonuclease-2
MPAELQPLLAELLYKPDRNKPETKALELACEQTGLSAVKLLDSCAAITSSHDYHLGRFLFEQFPKGNGFAAALTEDHYPTISRWRTCAPSVWMTPPRKRRRLSATPIEGMTRLGIHIAAPGLGFRPGSPVDGVARSRLSTVYFPGNKITMLPPPLIHAYSLAEGASRPALSLYVDFRDDDFSVANLHSAIERVPVAANLRHQNTERLDAAFEAGVGPDTLPTDVPFARELYQLWCFAKALESKWQADRTGTHRIQLLRRERSHRHHSAPSRAAAGQDRAELMILANSTGARC